MRVYSWAISILFHWSIYSIGLYVCLYVKTTQFWLWWLCSKFWNQLSSFSFSRLFWLFRAPSVSIQILKRVFLFLKKKNHWNFDWDCIESEGCLGSTDILNNDVFQFTSIWYITIYFCCLLFLLVIFGTFHCMSLYHLG